MTGNRLAVFMTAVAVGIIGPGGGYTIPCGTDKPTGKVILIAVFDGLAINHFGFAGDAAQFVAGVAHLHRIIGADVGCIGDGLTKGIVLVGGRHVTQSGVGEQPIGRIPCHGQASGVGEQAIIIVAEGNALAVDTSAGDPEVIVVGFAHATANLSAPAGGQGQEAIPGEAQAVAASLWMPYPFQPYSSICVSFHFPRNIFTQTTQITATTIDIKTP